MEYRDLRLQVDGESVAFFWDVEPDLPLFTAELDALDPDVAAALPDGRVRAQLGPTESDGKRTVRFDVAGIERQVLKVIVRNNDEATQS